MKFILLALLLIGCAPPAIQPSPDVPPIVVPLPPVSVPEPMPTPDSACLTVRLTLRDGVLVVTAAEPTAVMPLVRVRVGGVPGGLTGPDGIRLPDAGLYLLFRPDLSVQEAVPDGWRTCSLPA